LRVLARARGRIFRVLGAPDAAAWPELEQLPHWRQNTEGVRGRAPEHPPASRLPEYLAEHRRAPRSACAAAAPLRARAAPALSCRWSHSATLHRAQGLRAGFVRQQLAACRRASHAVVGSAGRSVLNGERARARTPRLRHQCGLRARSAASPAGSAARSFQRGSAAMGLLEDMLRFNPAQRVTPAQALEHAWFKEARARARAPPLCRPPWRVGLQRAACSAALRPCKRSPGVGCRAPACARGGFKHHTYP